MVSDEEQKVAAGEPDVASLPPPPTWRRFLKDVDRFDRITAFATTAIALMTAVYAYYARGQFVEMRAQLHSLQDAANVASQRFHNEHRPWVVLSASRLSAEPGTKAPTITLTFKNSGNTPASQVYWQGEMVMSATEPSDFKPQSADRLYIGAGGQLININQGNVTVEDVADTTRSQSNVAAYNEGKFKLYVHGIVNYEDRAKHQHKTIVCIYHAHGKGSTDFNACSTGNEIDTEPGW